MTDATDCWLIRVASWTLTTFEPSSRGSQAHLVLRDAARMRCSCSPERTEMCKSMTLVTRCHAFETGRDSLSPKYYDLRNCMEKLSMQGHPPIPSTSKLIVQIMFVDRH